MSSSPPSPALAKAAVLIVLFVVLACVSVWLGTDANYDMRNYHIYVGFAALHRAVGYDLAPAQLQSYLAPGVDVLYDLLLGQLNTRPVAMTVVWTLPTAVAAYLAFLIGLELMTGPRWTRFALAVSGAAVGASGAITVSTMGTTMSEAILSCLMLAGLLMLVRAGRPWMTGVLFGLTSALKLTCAPYAIALILALLVRAGRPGKGRAVDAMQAGSGAALAFACVAGPWWLAVYRVFGNPVFPFYNGVFRSPLFPPVNVFDHRYVPAGLLDAVLRPFAWGLTATTLVSESTLRDPRIALALVAALGAIVASVVARWRASAPVRRVDPLGFLAAWFLLSFAIWEWMFSILRYAACLEMLSGTLLMAVLSRCLPARHASRLPLAGAALAILLVAVNVYPSWYRLPLSAQAAVVDVSVPPVPPDGLIIILDGAPEAYLAMFFPATIRWVSVNNNLIQPSSVSGFHDLVAGTIRSYTGPILGLEKTDYRPGEADRSLARYRLQRSEPCVAVPSNLDATLRLCPLTRTPRAAGDG